MRHHEAQIWIRFTRPGFHYWPEAPDDTAYLRNNHRHLFHVEVSMPTEVDDKRTVEFHELMKHSRTVMRDVAKRGSMHDYGPASCESIAHSMAWRLSRVYERVVTVTVSEDGECGATVSVDPPEDF